MKHLKEKHLGLWLTLILLVPYLLQPIIAVAEGISDEVKETTTSISAFDFANTEKNNQATMQLDIKKESINKEEILIKSSEPVTSVKTNDSEEITTEVVEEGFKLTLTNPKESRMDFQLESSNENVESWTLTLPNGETKEIKREKNNLVDEIPKEVTKHEDKKEEETEVSKTINQDKKTRNLREPGNIRGLLQELNHGKSLIEKLSVTLNNKQPIPVEGIKADQALRLDIKWAIPEEVAQEMLPGDFYEFNLPNNIKIAPRTGELKGQNDMVFGKYTLASDGKVTFEFNDEISHHGFIEGGFIHNQQLKDISSPGKVELKLPNEDSVPPVELTVKSNTDSVIEKSGKTDKRLGANFIDWEIDINKSLTELKNVTVIDELPNGLTKESINVVPINVDLDGNVTGEQSEALVEGKDYKIENNNIIFLKEINQAYRIKFKTKIEKEAKRLEGEGGTSSFENKASLESDTINKSTTATVDATYRKNLEKDRYRELDDAGQIYGWKIKANYSENKLKAGTSINDRFKLDKEANYTMSLIPESLKIVKVTFDEDGNEQISQDTLPADSYKVVDKNHDGFDIVLTKEIENALYITYQTKVNGYISGSEALGNDVSIDGEYATGKQIGAYNQNLNKWFNGTDYENKRIGWLLDVNRANYLMKNWVLTDTLSPGLSLIEDSVRIAPVDGSPVLVKDKDYKIEVDGQKFSIIFLGDLATNGTNKNYRINYNTSFDMEKIDKGHEKEHENQFWNTASHRWTAEDGSEKTTKTGDVLAHMTEEFKFNGSKDVSYQIKTKTYDWHVNINLNRHKLVDGTVDDVIKGQHELIDDSVKIYELNVKSDGQSEVAKDVTEEVTHNIVKDGKNKTIHVSFPKNSTKAYRIDYKTTHEGKLVTAEGVKNNAVFENNHIKHELLASIQPVHAGKTIEKQGKVNPKNSNEILWDAVINSSQSHLENVVITDEPSNNQVLKPESFKLYTTHINEDRKQTITKDNELTYGKDYTVDIKSNSMTGKQVLTVKLIGDLAKIDTSYVLSYASILNNTTDSSNVRVFNNIKLSADHVDGMNTQSSKSVEVIDNEASATGKAGKIRIVKQSSLDQQPLQGAHFELWKTNRKHEKQQLLRSGVTNKEGQWDFGNIRPGKYLLVETKAPEHFLISPELKKGKLITVTPQTMIDELQVINEVNDPNDIVVKKVNKDGEPLQGAQFEVLDSTQKLVVNKHPLISNDKGEVRISELAEGTYYLKEISAPKGYIINNELVPIKVTNEKSPTINVVNYQGSVSFDKVDGETSDALNGAVFDIVSLDDPTNGVKNILGNDNGHFTVNHLAPGNYKLVERQAPKGYIKNTKAIEFTIPENASKEPETQYLGKVKNYKGSASFKKVSEDGKELSGAIFKVTNKKTKEVIFEELTGNDKGEFTLSNLSPGEYVIDEVKAPVGFIKNTESYEFTIDNDSSDKPKNVDIGSITNYKGKIIFDKVTETGESLKDARFKVINRETQDVVVDDIKANDKGAYTVENLEPGNYELKEVQAPNGYIRNKDVVKFTIPSEAKGKPDAQHLNDVVNYQGQIHFKKTNETHDLLPHAEFKLSDKLTGKVIKEHIKEVSTGEFTVTGLAPGEYELTETKAPEGYVLNTEVYSFTINKEESGKPQLVELNDVINYQGSVSFKKTDSQVKLLGGAVFEIRDAKTKHVVQKNIKEQSEGSFEVTGLAPNEYELVETIAPNGYILNTKPIKFTIDKKQKGQPKMVDLGDIPNYQGSVSFDKVDEKGNPLSGAVFKLINQESSEVINDSIKETANGHFDIHHLSPGKYVLEEVESPSGYIKNTQSIAFTIEKEIEGEPSVVTLDPFVNYQGSLVINKQSEEGTPLSNAKFELSRLDNDKEMVVATDLTTDLLGRVTVHHLVPGEYVLKEIKAPFGFKRNTQEFKFTVTSESLGKPEESIVTVSDYQGSIEITKINDQSEKLSGAEFIIRDAKTLQVVKENIVTDSTGKVSMTNLSPGSYELIETKAPTGYILNEEPVRFDITFEDNGKPKQLELSMTNYQGRMTLSKIDENGEALTGAVFNLINYDTKDVISENLKVDEKGQLLIENLAPGKYELEEIVAPVGYMINTDNTVFTIASSSIGKPEMVEETCINYQATISMKKVNQQGEGLAEATFELYDKMTGDLVRENLMSDDFGHLLIEKLAPGEYELKEISAPKGYVLNTQPVEFAVPTKILGKPELLELPDFINYQGSIEFNKVDEHANPLSGAAFDIISKETGEVVQATITGDENGHFVVKNLAPGEYELKETSAPKGYVLSKESVDFTIDAKHDGKLSSVKITDFVNKKEVINKPNEHHSTNETPKKEVTDSKVVTNNNKATLKQEISKQVSTKETTPSQPKESKTAPTNTSTLPKLGEKITTHLIISTIGLVVIALMIFIFKRREK